MLVITFLVVFESSSLLTQFINSVTPIIFFPDICYILALSPKLLQEIFLSSNLSCIKSISDTSVSQHWIIFKLQPLTICVLQLKYLQSQAFLAFCSLFLCQLFTYHFMNSNHLYVRQKFCNPKPLVIALVIPNPRPSVIVFCDLEKFIPNLKS